MCPVPITNRRYRAALFGVPGKRNAAHCQHLNVAGDFQKAHHLPHLKRKGIIERVAVANKEKTHSSILYRVVPQPQYAPRVSLQNRQGDIKAK